MRMGNIITQLADYTLPSNILYVFNIARYYFATNEVINSNIVKLATYPISRVIVTSKSDEIARQVEDILADLNMKQLLINLGTGVFTYGTSMVGFMRSFRRRLKCPKCGTTYDIDNEKKYWDFRGGKFYVKCKKCKGVFEAELEDIPQDKTLPRLIPWSVFEVVPDYNKYSGNTTYYKYITEEERAKIKERDIDFLRYCPKLLLEAYRKRKIVVLNPSNQYQFINFRLPDIWPSYGFPPLLPLFILLHHLGLMTKANEALAKDYIMPLRFIVPGDPMVKTGAPNITVNLKKWEQLVKSHIKKWRKDPLHIGFIPLPANTIYFSGNARQLMTPDIAKLLKDDITSGMGMPAGFFRGLLNWTGQSVSLRMLENQFLNHRVNIHNYLNKFLFPKLGEIYSIDPKSVTLSLEKFKMADDIQYKQLLVGANQSGKVSDDTLLDSLGLDSSKELEKIKKELFDKLELEKVQEELKQLLAESMERFTSMQSQVHQVDMDRTLDRWISILQRLTPLQREQLLSRLKQSSPSTYSILRQRIAAMSQPQTSEAPLPEQKPPRRKESPI